MTKIRWRTNGGSAPVRLAVSAALMVGLAYGCSPASTASPAGSGAVPSGSAGASQTARPGDSASEVPALTPVPNITPKIGGVVKWTPSTLPPGLAVTDQSVTQNEFFGWSKGYLAFSESLAGGSAVPWTSADGRNWAKGTALDLTGLSGSTGVSEVVEGPAGLLALGRTPGCLMNGQGCVPDAAKALWTSPDGRNWSRVDLAGQFGGKAVGSVSAGPKGYMAISVSSDSAVAEPLVWLSANGRTWRSSPFPAAAFLNAYLASSLVLSNGYLVAGRIGSVAGYGSGSYPLTTPQLWWSADGISWTQLPMPGLKAAPEAEAAVTRISDGRFIAHVVNWDGPVPPDGPTQLWASSDGVTWSAAGPGFPAPAVILSDGHQALEPTTTDAGVTVATSTDGLAWTQRVVDGAGPGDWTAAVVGPSGLLVSSGNSQVWLAALA